MSHISPTEVKSLEGQMVSVKKSNRKGRGRWGGELSLRHQIALHPYPPFHLGPQGSKDTAFYIKYFSVTVENSVATAVQNSIQCPVQTFQKRLSNGEFHRLLPNPLPPTFYIKFHLSCYCRLLNPYLVLSLMPESRKWNFQVSRL